jgi:hypothetical membrane protein
MNRMRVGAFAGVGAAVLITCGWIVGGLLQGDGYSWSSQEISDLGALTAEHAWVWNLADSLSGVLILIFAVGLFAALRSSRAGRVGATLIGVVGVGSVIDGIAREDCPLSTSAACQRLQDGPGLSWHHQVHNIESVIVVVAMLTAPFVIARALRLAGDPRGLRIYTLATGFAQVVVTATYLMLYGDPGGGIAQRLLIVVFMAWIAALSLSLLSDYPETPTHA